MTYLMQFDFYDDNAWSLPKVEGMHRYTGWWKASRGREYGGPHS